MCKQGCHNLQITGGIVGVEVVVLEADGTNEKVTKIHRLAHRYCLHCDDVGVDITTRTIYTMLTV